MPIVDIKLTEPINRVNCKVMIAAVSKAIAQTKPCPIEAVVVNIIPLPTYQIGQGGKTWEDINDQKI